MSKQTIVARVEYRPDQHGPVAVVEALGPGRYSAFWDGGCWGDGADSKQYRTVALALAAIAAEVKTMEDEGFEG